MRVQPFSLVEVSHPTTLLRRANETRLPIQEETLDCAQRPQERQLGVGVVQTVGDGPWLPQSWSRSRLRNCRRLRRRRVPGIPLLRRPVWCRQQWQRLKCQRQGACHSDFIVDSIAGDTAGNSTRPSRTFVMKWLASRRATRRLPGLQLQPPALQRKCAVPKRRAAGPRQERAAGPRQEADTTTTSRRDRTNQHFKEICQAEETRGVARNHHHRQRSTALAGTFTRIDTQSRARNSPDHAPSTSHGEINGKEPCCRCGSDKQKQRWVSIKRWHQPHGRPMRSATGSKAMKALKRGSVRPRFR